MAYELSWSRSHPGHVVYLLDLSYSMAQKNKIDKLLTAVQEVVKDLIAEATPDDKILDYMSLSIIGYNSRPTTLVDNKTLSQLYDLLISGKPILDKEGNAKPQWQTFTADAFQAAIKDIQAWIEERKKANSSIPAPLVVHVTDGYPYEGEGTDDSSRMKALRYADELKNIHTDDGNVRLFNIHIEPDYPTFSFPTERPSGSYPPHIIKALQFLYDSASAVDEHTRQNADMHLGVGTIKSGAKLMVSNVSGERLLCKLIKFGSTPGSKPNQAQTVYQEPPMPS